MLSMFEILEFKFVNILQRFLFIYIVLTVRILKVLIFRRPYAGGFIANDPQRRLDLLKPRLPNGECPPGFLGFAVNMINIDSTHLFCLTANGYGLRETLFYSLFSRLQVYKTRADMLQALPCISDGALSLDGGIIKATGVFCLGNQYEALFQNRIQVCLNHLVYFLYVNCLLSVDLIECPIYWLDHGPNPILELYKISLIFLRYSNV